MTRLTFTKTSELRNAKPADWLIKGIIPEHITGMVCGLEGSHKSFIALDMMLSVVTGTPYHGHAVKQVKGLYVASEGGEPLGQRIRAWEQVHNIEVDDEQLDWFMEETIQLDNTKDVELLIPEIREQGPQFIIFDTLRTSSSGDEISTEVMSAITRSLRLIQRECGATVYVVHHSTKGNPRGYSGSGVLGSNLASYINVLFDEKQGTTHLTCDKMKDAAKFAPLRFGHRAVGKSLVMELKANATADTKVDKPLAANHQTILDGLEIPVERAEYRKRMEAEGIIERTFDRAIKALQERELIVITADNVITRLS